MTDRKRQCFLDLVVGARGFEPPTPRSRTECSTRLSHAPTLERCERRTGGGANELLSYLSFTLQRQLFNRRHRVMRGQVGMKRRQGNVPVPHRFIVRPI